MPEILAPERHGPTQPVPPGTGPTQDQGGYPIFQVLTGGLAVFSLVALFLSLRAPFQEVINPGALALLGGCLRVAMLGCLLTPLWPKVGLGLALLGVGESYLLVPLITPSMGPAGSPLPPALDPFGAWWGDSRYGLVAAQFGVALLLGRRAGLAAALAYLSLPGFLHLVEVGRLPSFQLLVLVSLVACYHQPPRHNPSHPGGSAHFPSERDTMVDVPS